MHDEHPPAPSKGDVPAVATFCSYYHKPLAGIERLTCPLSYETDRLSQVHQMTNHCWG